MKLINELGNRYGSLVVIDQDKKYNKTAWKCQCDCGNVVIATGSELRAGRITSCGVGCPTKLGKGKFKDLSGQRFGRLLVLYRNGSSKSKKVLWHCQCDCGKEVDVISAQLLNGKTQSCGCLQRELFSEKQVLDLSNQRFGKLVAIEYKGIKNHKAMWLCKCDCGNFCEIPCAYLRSGNTKSCGCLSMKSWGEWTISQILNDKGISYISQYSFDDLRSDVNVKLRFDFALFYQNQIVGLIEYQGPQHYDETNSFYTSKLVEHDAKKYNYCLSRNIPLLYLDKTSNIEIEVLDFYNKQLEKRNKIYE